MMHGEHDSNLYKYCPSEESLSGVMVQRITHLMEHRADLGEIRGARRGGSKGSECVREDPPGGSGGGAAAEDDE